MSFITISSLKKPKPKILLSKNHFSIFFKKKSRKNHFDLIFFFFLSSTTALRYKTFQPRFESETTNIFS